MERPGGDIDPGHFCPQQRPGEGVGTDITQQVDQGFAPHIAHLREDQVVEQGFPGEEPVDVVIFVVDLSQLIPALLVGVGHMVNGGILLGFGHIKQTN